MDLNPKQKEAVAHKDGPLLIVAGAGSGKTRVITERIIELIKSGVRPENILAVTFTNKAAEEMRLRVAQKIQDARNKKQTGGAFISTFHSMGVHILRNHGKVIDIPRFFSILDRNDSVSVIKKAMKKIGLNPKEFSPKNILGTISKQKGNLVSRKDYEQLADDDFYPRLVLQIWQKYEEELKKNDALDFDDLLLKTVHLFQKSENVLRHYQNLWKYIHVDEYQDTNPVQYEMSRLLADKHKNICVVGDHDQNIYSWRGSTLDNILRFEKDFSGTKVVLLEENYRSTKNILSAANQVIKKNKKRKEKNLFTQNKEGEKITFFTAFDEKDEAGFVVEKSAQLIKSGLRPDEIAVLYRANFQSRVLEENFLFNDVPYQVIGTRFFERKEVKDVLAYIKASVVLNDKESISRVINVPRRGIGEKTLEKIFAGQSETLPAGVKEKLKYFKLFLSEIRGTALSKKPSETVKFVIEKSGLVDELKKDKETGEERVENVMELVSLASKYDVLAPEEGIEKLLTECALVSDQDTLDKNKNGVRLMTVHSAKGLEFKYIFIVGLEQGLFPHDRTFGDEESDDEEERRLFYVALTRAQEKVFLSYASVRTIYGRQEVNVPSEFITDIEEALVEDSGTQQGAGTTNYLEDVIDY